ncbi:hypothetical protein DFJ58DRAFT_723689 [Suillus subalutaceus]|uniref:uncharacterized protein n=1 Tax=Suillus subalutaceus TaxID=48586 RepID=UPI001B869C6E|nr:uncharacterized protein DFJ58DRAFT_723689 [Suillus subalutaceus]KAG1867817.1 hypothetical protein DFJ58DRAFT_723689 [Suillus subalutaceus]
MGLQLYRDKSICANPFGIQNEIVQVVRPEGEVLMLDQTATTSWLALTQHTQDSELSHGVKETPSIMPTSDSTSISIQGPDLEKTAFLLPGSQAHAGYGEFRSLSLDSSYPASPPAYVPKLLPRSLPAPIPIPKRASSNSRNSSFSNSRDSAASTPTFIPSSGSPKLWQRLTRATSRNALGQEPPAKEKTMSGLSRILNKRNSASLARRPTP